MCGGAAAQREATVLRNKLAKEDVDDARGLLEDARKDLRKRRTKAWKEWVRGNLKSKARTVYAWAKRVIPIREEGLNWGSDDCPVGVGVRVERGKTERSKFWT